MSGEDLEISVSEHDNARIVELVGELDSYTAGRMSEMTDDLVQGIDRLVVNMDQLSYIDSAGLSVVVGLWARAVQGGVQVRILCNNARVRRVLEITGLLQFFSMDTAGLAAHGLKSTPYDRAVAIQEEMSSKETSPPAA